MFQVIWTDWFDRLSAPVRFYNGPEDPDGRLTRTRFDRARITATGLFGWRAYWEQM